MGLTSLGKASKFTIFTPIGTQRMCGPGYPKHLYFLLFSGRVTVPPFSELRTTTVFERIRQTNSLILPWRILLKILLS